MTTAATSLLGLALPVTGELSGTWGDTVNNSITSLLDSAIAGTTTLSTDADVTLTTTTLAANQAREAIILWTASGTVTRNITAPAQSKIYTVINKTGSTQSIVLRGAGPTTGVTIVAGEKALCSWNGSDFVKISTTATASSFSAGTTGFTPSTATTGAITLAGTLAVANGGTNLTSFTSGGVVYASSSSALATGSALVFDGSNLGLGVTPSAWYTASGFKALQLGLYGFTSVADGGSAYTSRLMNNSYYNASGIPIFAGSNYASEYRQTAGTHSWHSSTVSGTAGNAISFTQAMTLDASGNLLVGTTSGSYGGRVVSYGGTLSLVTDTSAQRRLSFYSTANGTSENAYIQVQNDGATTNTGEMLFATRNTSGTLAERARIDSNGKFTLSADSAGMEINSGTYQVKSKGSGQAYMGFVTVTTALQCSFNSTSAGVSLGSGATSWGTFSDESMKDIIEPITDATNKISTLRAVIGKYKTDAEGTRRSFLIAQDVQAVLPEAVDSEISENLVLRYTEVIPLLVAAIKEQQALITTLTERITALEGAK